LGDINRVFGWMLAHASEYGLDTDHVFAVGDYEGAHQLAAYCNFLTNPACAAKYPFTPPEGLGILGLALNSGTYAIAPNVLEYVTVHFPPTFVMTCTDDPLIGQALHMIKALIGKGVTHELQIYGNSEMGLEQSFYRDQCGFFRTLL
jgi:acetyl esterase/lipase